MPAQLRRRRRKAPDKHPRVRLKIARHASAGKEKIMSNLVQLTKDNDIAIITINNPPVNALSPGVPEGISEAIDQVSKDASVKAALLIGGGRTFVAGADIKEFGKITSGQSQRGVAFV